MQILFNNATEYTYDYELLLIIQSFDSEKEIKKQHLELFGGLISPKIPSFN